MAVVSSGRLARFLASCIAIPCGCAMQQRIVRPTTQRTVHSHTMPGLLCGGRPPWQSTCQRGLWSYPTVSLPSDDQRRRCPSGRSTGPYLPAIHDSSLVFASPIRSAAGERIECITLIWVIHVSTPDQWQWPYIRKEVLSINSPHYLPSFTSLGTRLSGSNHFRTTTAPSTIDASCSYRTSERFISSSVQVSLCAALSLQEILSWWTYFSISYGPALRNICVRHVVVHTSHSSNVFVVCRCSGLVWSVWLPGVTQGHRGWVACLRHPSKLNSFLMISHWKY